MVQGFRFFGQNNKNAPHEKSPLSALVITVLKEGGKEFKKEKRGKYGRIIGRKKRVEIY